MKIKDRLYTLTYSYRDETGEHWQIEPHMKLVAINKKTGKVVFERLK